MLDIKHNKTVYRRDSGFTLIELMLAMLIGLIIMGGVMQMFITTRDTQRTSEDQMQLISDARFIMETIGFDLRHAGIWGGTNETSLIRCGTDVTQSLVCPPSDVIAGGAADDCVAGWYINLSTPVIAFDNANPYITTCATQGYQPNTDVLALHYADTIPIPTGTLPGQLANGVVYVRSNSLAGQLFVGNSYPAETGLPRWKDQVRTKNYPLKASVYYVSGYTNTPADAMPSLHRVELLAGPSMVDRVLIPGVEDLQFEFGVDTTGDAQVDIYMNATAVTTGGYWATGKVLAVKIWLLMRAQNPDRDGVGGSQTFTLAGTSTDYTDGVRRFLMTSVVRLRNTFRRDLSK